MKVLQTISQIVIYSSLMVSISCAFLCYGFCSFLEISNAIHYAIIAGSGTFSIYNLQRFVKLRQQSNKSEHLQWVEKHSSFLFIATVLSCFVFTYFVFCLLNYSPSVLVLGGVATCLSVFYVVRIKGKNLREIPYLKIHIITLTWVFTCFFFPLINEAVLNINAWIFGGVHYVYILAICIPFDIRDISYDDKSQKTIPQLLGLRSAKMIAMLLLIAFYISALAFYPILGESILFQVAVIAQILLVYFSSSKNHDFYFGGLIDGTILLLGLAYFFG